ncbi:MAG: DUF488 domain-containing protein [Candidatus Saccharimonadales bacterium]
MIRIKRVYEEPSKDDGFRILVDRLWPRGVSKDKAAVDIWLKEIGPSTELRNWFGHVPAKFDEFKKRYKKELKDNPDTNTLNNLIADHKTVTLVYGAKNTEANQAVVLKSYFK